LGGGDFALEFPKIGRCKAKKLFAQIHQPRPKMQNYVMSKPLKKSQRKPPKNVLTKK
jgi:hypothetical protein